MAPTLTLTPIATTLAYGHKHGTVPAEVLAAWGARWIVHGGVAVDQVWDRTSVIGEPEAKARLLAHLSEHVKALPARIVESKLASGEAAPDTEVVVLDDGVVRILGRASGGYFYITAFLLEGLPVAEFDFEDATHVASWYQHGDLGIILDEEGGTVLSDVPDGWWLANPGTTPDTDEPGFGPVIGFLWGRGDTYEHLLHLAEIDEPFGQEIHEGERIVQIVDGRVVKVTGFPAGTTIYPAL